MITVNCFGCGVETTNVNGYCDRCVKREVKKINERIQGQKQYKIWMEAFNRLSKEEKQKRYERFLKSVGVEV